jgi:hypothetical protein
MRSLDALISLLVSTVASPTERLDLLGQLTVTGLVTVPLDSLGSDAPQESVLPLLLASNILTATSI